MAVFDLHDLSWSAYNLNSSHQRRSSLNLSVLGQSQILNVEKPHSQKFVNFVMYFYNFNEIVNKLLRKQK